MATTTRRLALWVALSLAVLLAGAVGLSLAAPQILQDEAVGD